MDNNKTSIEKTENAKKIANRLNSNKGFYESMEEGIVKFFRWISGIVDKLFFSPKYSILFALLLSCLAYFIATYDNSNTTLTSSKVLSGISINTRYNSESFELNGVPAACEVVITGEAANVTNAAAKKGYCQIDLEGYTEGTHTIKMSAIGYGDNVNAIVSPSEVMVTLKKKTTMQFDLAYDYINKNAMDSKYILGIPGFSQGTKINIRASQDTLNSIALVKALIDVSQIDVNKIDENDKTSKTFEIEAPIVAYDKNGKTIDAEIVPDRTKVSVTIGNPSKKVPIELKPNGSIPIGLAIDEVQIVNHETVTLYAPQEVLNTISKVYVDFDMSTITESANLEMILPITLPNGVNASDTNVVNVKVTLAQIEEREIEGISLNFEDNVNNLAIAKMSEQNVKVKIKGSQKNISSVNEEDIYVYFKMPEEVGEDIVCDLYAKVNNNPYVTVEIENPKVTITTVKSN